MFNLSTTLKRFTIQVEDLLSLKEDSDSDATVPKQLRHHIKTAREWPNFVPTPSTVSLTRILPSGTSRFLYLGLLDLFLVVLYQQIPGLFANELADIYNIPLTILPIPRPHPIASLPDLTQLYRTSHIHLLLTSLPCYSIFDFLFPYHLRHHCRDFS